MTKTQRRRFIWIFFIVLAMSLAVGLTLYALQQNITLFYTPTQVALGEAPQHQLIRIGGMVKPHSVIYDKQGLGVNFMVTDYQHEVMVSYQGVLPDLFREEQGIVVQGKLDSLAHLQATQVLAKHDENYMPPEVKKSLEQKK